jgi:hypothetical protein
VAHRHEAESGSQRGLGAYKSYRHSFTRPSATASLSTDSELIEPGSSECWCTELPQKLF